MIEDKLTHEQRIRLEALNQAHQRCAMQRPSLDEEFFWLVVKDYYWYILNGKSPLE